MRRVAKPLALAFILPVLMATLLAACSMTEQDSLTTGDTPTPAANPSSMSTAPNPGLSAPATPEPTVSPAPIPTESPRALPVQPSSRYASAGPAGDFYLAADLVSVSSGYAHICGLRSDGTAVCWGRDWEGQSSEPGARSRQSAPSDTIRAEPGPRAGWNAGVRRRARSPTVSRKPMKPTRLSARAPTTCVSSLATAGQTVGPTVMAPSMGWTGLQPEHSCP